MEGFMDVIAAYRAGHVNAVASMGTALTPEHVNRLRKLTKKIVLTYDIYRKHPKKLWVNSWSNPAFQMWNFG